MPHLCSIVPPSDLALVTAGRCHRLTPGQRVDVHGVAFRPDGTSVRARDPRQSRLRVAGEPTGAARLELGDAVLVGRTPVLVARLHTESRYADVVSWQGLMARDTRSLQMLEALATAAAVDAPVFLAGESGTGKELAARAIHATSRRRRGPLVALNCATLPEQLAEAELFGVARGAYTGADRARAGAFEEADGGTLFLDEVGELPPAVQAKLLRVLETGELRRVGGRGALRVDVRFVVATWRDLDREVADGRFRFDLLQRLQVLAVELPPLRERPRDIEPLLEACLAEHGASDLWPGPSPLRRLVRADWPGNVRELRNRTIRVSVTGDLGDLVPRASNPLHLERMRRGMIAPNLALARIHDALATTGGNRTEAARTLGISRSTLYRWLRSA